jgi:hypothetical protein
MVSRRERIRGVFRGDPSPVPPVCIRMDLWFNHARELDLLPSEIKGLTLEQIEDSLGFCRSARYRAKARLEFPEGWITRDSSNDETVTSFCLPGVTLRKRERLTPEQRLASMRPFVTKYPIQTASDCKAFLCAIEHASLEADVDGFEEYDWQVGDAGLPLLIIGPCPAHYVMQELTGYEMFFYAMRDYPDTLNALIDTLETRFRKELWERVVTSSAELILHGEHFSDTMTPKPIFREHFLPYFSEFNCRAHAVGKKVLWHADAGMGTLLELVMEAGFDGADCLATAPLVQQTIEDYDRAWQGRIVCWGGIPGTLFDPAVSHRDFVNHIEHLRQYTADRRGFLTGASDNVLPGAEWERTKILSERFSRTQASNQNQSKGATAS